MQICLISCSLVLPQVRRFYFLPPTLPSWSGLVWDWTSNKFYTTIAWMWEWSENQLEQERSCLSVVDIVACLSWSVLKITVYLSVKRRTKTSAKIIAPCLKCLYFFTLLLNIQARTYWTLKLFIECWPDWRGPKSGTTISKNSSVCDTMLSANV